MSGFDHLDLIWLSELNMAVIYARGDVPREFVTAAIILKGEDGTDLFVPYEGYVTGAPIGFSLGRGGTYSISVIGFGPGTDPVELGFWELNESLVAGANMADQEPVTEVAAGSLNSSEAGNKTIDMNVMGFGELNRSWKGELHSEIGYNSVNYNLDGMVDYNELLTTYLLDMRRLEDESFTSYFVTAAPYRRDGTDGVEVGPALHLRPLHHFQFGLSVFCQNIEVADLDEGAEDEDAPFEDAGSFSPMENAAILSRHGGFEFRDVPEFILNAGTSREQVDFVLRDGFQVHWRRQFENWSHDSSFVEPKAGGVNQASFIMEPLLERTNLVQQDGQSFFRWTVDEAVIGDVVGLVFCSEDSSIDLDVMLRNKHEGDAGQQPGELTLSTPVALFIFMGEQFVPLTNEILAMSENLGITARLQGHIDRGLQKNRSLNSLRNERARNATGLLERDQLMQEIFQPKTLQDIASKGPFGPELMVYRDHILRVSGASDMALWMADIEAPSVGGRRGRLIDILRFETFCKAPQLAHALVFNESFRQKFQSKPIDPHSFNMPVLEYLMSKLYSDPVIDWAMKLKGESQAILWQLVLKRPDMVDRLYELKLEPDIALNPFDDKVLSHVESALNDSSQIDVDLIEKKVIPVFKALGQQDKVNDLADFSRALSLGAEGKALSLGELSVCLAAVETATTQWTDWREEAVDLFQSLVSPLHIEVPLFDEGDDFSAVSNLKTKRDEIAHLTERLGKELGVSSQELALRLDYIFKMESEVLLDEISSKLDLALKYHRDLSVGVEKLYDHFQVLPADLVNLRVIEAAGWPTMDDFPPSFADPLVKKKQAQQKEFERLIKVFAQKAHPNDNLFHTTLIEALDDLSSCLPLLMWLDVGQDMEQRVALVQKRLENAVLKVNPASAKLRRSKVISEAVRQIVIAERMGATGWPLLSQSLDLIEQDLPNELM